MRLTLYRTFPKNIQLYIHTYIHIYIHTVQRRRVRMTLMTSYH